VLGTPLNSPNRLNWVGLKDVTCHRICPGA